MSHKNLILASAFMAIYPLLVPVMNRFDSPAVGGLAVAFTVAFTVNTIIYKKSDPENTTEFASFVSSAMVLNMLFTAIAFTGI